MVPYRCWLREGYYGCHWSIHCTFYELDSDLELEEESVTVIPQSWISRSVSSGSSSRVRGGGRNMKSMWLPLAVIFFMTYFHRARGGHGPLAPPLDPLLGLGLVFCLMGYLRCMGPWPRSMGSTKLCKSVHTALRQGQGYRPIVSYCVSPVTCTSPGPCPCSVVKPLV